MVLEIFNSPAENQWEPVLDAGGKYIDRIKEIKVSSARIPKWLELSRQDIPTVLSSDLLNLVNALTGPSRKVASLLQPDQGRFAQFKKLFSSGVPRKKVYSTEKSIAYAHLAERLLQIVSQAPEISSAELRNIIAASAVRMILDFGRKDEFSFAEITETALVSATLENRGNIDALRDLRQAQMDVESVVNNLSGKAPTGSVLAATEQGTVIMAVANKIISPITGVLLNMNTAGIGGNFARQRQSRITENQDVLKLLNNIVGKSDGTVGETFLPDVAINSALIIPIELVDTRSNRTDYLGSQSPIPD